MPPFLRRLLLAIGASGAVLGVVHGLRLHWRYAHLALSEQSQRGFLELGLVTGWATMALLAVPVLVARRWVGDGWERVARVMTALGAAAGTIALLAEPVPWLLVSEVVIVALAAAGFGYGVRPPPERVALGITGLGLSLLVALRITTLAMDPWPTSPGTRVPPADDLPDLVVVTLGSLRADRVGALGADPTLTPALDAWSAQGTVFTAAVAASSWSVPALATLLTGVPVQVHGAGAHGDHGSATDPILDAVPTLPERLHAAGYRTRAVVAHPALTPALGFARGFDTFDNPSLRSARLGVLLDVPLTRWIVRRLPVAWLGDTRADTVVDRALPWLDEPAGPVFLWVHLSDPRSLYTPDPTAWRLTSVADDHRWPPADTPDFSIASYDASVRATDAALGRLLDHLTTRERAAFVVVTADHGEALGERGVFGSGHSLREEITHIPLTAWGRDGVPAGIVDNTVGHVDIAPTLLGLAGLAPGAALEGAWSGHPDAWPRTASGARDGTAHTLVALDHWRWVTGPEGGALYDLIDDPAQTRDVALEHPEVVERLEAAAPRPPP